MAVTCNGRQTDAANNNNAETRRTPGGANGTPQAEDEASSHPPRRVETPPPPPPQPSVRNEPSGSLVRRAQPTRSMALQMVRELLGNPHAPEGHAAWLARVQELV